MNRTTLLAATLGALTVSCGEPAARAPTYAEDIAPILRRECTSCHVEGGIAPFPLTSFEDARANAAAINLDTRTRRMPPYLVDNSGACNTFQDARWLSEEELAAIDRWVTEGTKPGTSQPDPPARSQASLQTSATLDIGTDYTPNEALTDDYRCFLVDPGITEDRFLTAYEVVPGDARIVHHVILYSIDDDGGETFAANLDDKESGPGYTCFGTSGLSFQSSRAIAAWAPGVSVTRYPEGTGVKLHAGHRAILQVHYNLRNGAAPDRTKIRLELKDLVDKPAQILGVGDLGLELAPRQAHVETEPVQITPGIGGFVRGVFPHMHRLGRELHAKIRHTDDRATCLTEVPAWDFSWQQFYFLEKPMYVLSTDRIELSCVYDTSLRSEPVRWGEGTDDEMCLLGLYVTFD